jgi:hypothetical protein
VALSEEEGVWQEEWGAVDESVLCLEKKTPLKTPVRRRRRFSETITRRKRLRCRNTMFLGMNVCWRRGGGGTDASKETLLVAGSSVVTLTC